MSIQRWTKTYVQDPEDHENWSSVMQRTDDGAYVLFADHEAEVAALRALVARQQAELRRLEWRDGTRFVGEGVPIQCCPSCQSVMVEERQHCDDCPLDALLADRSAQAAEAWLREREKAAVKAALEKLSADLHDEDCKTIVYVGVADCIAIINRTLARLKEAP